MINKVDISRDTLHDCDGFAELLRPEVFPNIEEVQEMAAMQRLEQGIKIDVFMQSALGNPAQGAISSKHFQDVVELAHIDPG